MKQTESMPKAYRKQTSEQKAVTTKQSLEDYRSITVAALYPPAKVARLTRRQKSDDGRQRTEDGRREDITI